MGSHYIWDRSEIRELMPHFTTKEFSCLCGKCKTQKMNKDLVILLEDLRVVFNKPLTVTSGFRCAAYHKHLTKSGLPTAVKSQHLLGNAVDITCDSFKDNVFLLVNLSMKFGIKSIGVAHNFIHLDTRMDKQRLWIY